MTGLILLIQIIHYPAYSYIDLTQFARFQKFHVSRITWLVAPTMIVELITAGLLTWQNQEILFKFNLISIILIWIITFTLNVPIHTLLLEKYDVRLVRKLILTNWPRTLLWVLRALFWAFYLLKA
jgi:hypothetical protein